MQILAIFQRSGKVIVTVFMTMSVAGMKESISGGHQPTIHSNVCFLLTVKNEYNLIT